MPEYINNNSHTVYLPGQDGKTVQLRSNEKKHLPEYFDKYCTRGYISRTDRPSENQNIITQKRNNAVVINKTKTTSVGRMPKKIVASENQRVVYTHPTKRMPKNHAGVAVNNQKPVGRRINIDAIELLKENIARHDYPISNNIGIGILSYNRPESLKRLVDSIIKYTDLRRTRIFISDDNSDNQELLAYYDYIDNHYNDQFVVIRNKKQLGIAGNSNRLLRCLKRFKYGMLLNDDVEILSGNWDTFYFNVMNRTGYNHYIYREIGVYGADAGIDTYVADIKHHKITEKPHGAVLAFTTKCLDNCGYFDTSYGLYGMEHVDWSTRIYEMNMQPDGFFDVEGSNKYFKIHSEKSIIDDKSKHLAYGRDIFKKRESKFVPCDDESIVPAISYVIPVRNINRGLSINTVVNNIRAQSFPVIEIIISEHDIETNINVEEMIPIKYCLSTDNTQFNKSKAFNMGVSLVSNQYVVLHDADTLVQNHYTKVIYDNLLQYDACHLGKTVIYTCKESADEINDTGIIDDKILCERVVGYYEGGSLACSTHTYWRIGGFNEDFVGYGCEDTEFYNRLSKNCNWLENRIFDLLHLWHPRTPGWGECHMNNKMLEAKLHQTPMENRIKSQYNQLSGKYSQIMEHMYG